MKAAKDGSDRAASYKKKMKKNLLLKLLPSSRN